MPKKVFPPSLSIGKAVLPPSIALLLVACLQVPANLTVTPFILPSRTPLLATSTLPAMTPTSKSTATPEPFSRYASLPSGQYIVYSAEGGLYVISVDGQVHEKLTDFSGVSVSPDGTRIYDDAIYDLAASQVFPDPVPQDIGCRVWSGSPDGAMLALECNDYEVYALSVRDGNLVRLSSRLSEVEAHFAPMWSPNGKWIAYFKIVDSPPECRRELYLADVSCIAEPDTCTTKTRGPFLAHFFHRSPPTAGLPIRVIWRFQTKMGMRF